TTPVLPTDSQRRSPPPSTVGTTSTSRSPRSASPQPNASPLIFAAPRRDRLPHPRRHVARHASARRLPHRRPEGRRLGRHDRRPSRPGPIRRRRDRRHPRRGGVRRVTLTDEQRREYDDPDAPPAVTRHGAALVDWSTF